MSQSPDDAALVRAETARLSRRAVTSIVGRGLGELPILESAENWYQKALERWEPGRYQDALAFIRRGIALDSKHSGLQYLLGFAYYSGYGVERDRNTAAVCFERAAQQGHADAEFALGWQYEYGQGVFADYSKAAAWYFLSAEHGHGLAAFRLATLYREGQGVRPDPAHAAAYFRIAAERGVDGAAEALALLGS